MPKSTLRRPRINPHRLGIALLLGCAALPASAFDWPWQEEGSGNLRYSYCKGFVVAALGANPVEQLSRTDLWLAWNTINREAIPPDTAPDADYQSGHQQFEQLLANNNLGQLRDVANGDCALGRN